MWRSSSIAFFVVTKAGRKPKAPHQGLHGSLKTVTFGDESAVTPEPGGGGDLDHHDLRHAVGACSPGRRCCRASCMRRGRSSAIPALPIPPRRRTDGSRDDATVLRFRVFYDRDLSQGEDPVVEPGDGFRQERRGGKIAAWRSHPDQRVRPQRRDHQERTGQRSLPSMAQAIERRASRSDVDNGDAVAQSARARPTSRPIQGLADGADLAAAAGSGVGAGWWRSPRSPGSSNFDPGWNIWAGRCSA